MKMENELIVEMRDRAARLCESFRQKKKNYVFGMGGVGTNFFNILIEYGITPDGFIVSVGHRTQPKYRGVPVYEIDEVSLDSDESCVYFALHNGTIAGLG